jgi:hypothetical protein
LSTEHPSSAGEMPRTGTGKLDRHKLETQIVTDLAST